MLRKALSFGIVFILALSLLAVSMITCFTYDATAHPPGPGHYHMDCHKVGGGGVQHGVHNHPGAGWCCEPKYWVTQ